MSATSYPHVETTPDGTPVIVGTRTKVVEVVLDRLAHHWDADEIQRQHPHLTLAQIHGALAYYYDHQEPMDRDIERRLRQVAEIRKDVDDSSVRLKLRAAGRLP